LPEFKETIMASKLLLIDGHNLLFRMFYGIPGRIPGKDGRSIHGAVGFIGTLLKTLALFEPTHMVVLFDHEGGSFRNEIDKDYKNNQSANRVTDEDPFSQLEHLYLVLDHIGCKHAETVGFEVDDIIAAYVRRHECDADITILSTDSDLLQLVKPGVSVYSPRGKQSVLYGSTEVEAKYGVMPQFIPDLKALTGDKSDNLVGISGIGPKTASDLIRRFGGVTQIFERLEAIGRDRTRNLLMTHRNQVFHNLSFIRLDRPASLPFSLSELALSNKSWQHKTMELLREAGIAAS
jgi:DNA polymerase-1